MSILDDFKNAFRMRHQGVSRLILVNVVVYLVANIAIALLRLNGSPEVIAKSDLLGLLGLPSQFSLALEHIWSLFSYMFFHLDFMHVFFNMIWLYSIGTIFSELMGSKSLVGTYILGGLSGGILFLLVGSLFPGPFTGGVLLGASAGVMAVVIASAVYAPNLTLQVVLLGPVRLKYIALVCFVSTSLMDLSDNTGGKIAHIGGALFGLVFALQYKKGNDLTRGITGIFDLFASIKLPAGRKNVKVAYKRPVSDEVYNETRVEEQKRVNEILDKISRAGYDSLSKDEKDFLFRSSKKM
jgi:membrane associated rhomboid family serine protease